MTNAPRTARRRRMGCRRNAFRSRARLDSLREKKTMTN